MSLEVVGRRPDGTAGFLHVDMDAFYASVEIRRRPELHGQPVIVGGAGERGVVAAASYEARAFGIHSAMPSTRARRLCPHVVFLHGDHAHYAEVSAEVMEIFHCITPLVEPLSLDEAFLDVRGAAHILGAPSVIAADIRAQVLAEQRLTCSVGVAATKFLAKLATERAKPAASESGPIFGSGVHIVAEGSELDFLHPMPATELWGVGPATARRLSSMGVETIGDLAALPESRVVASLGHSVGRHLHRLANGVDERAVVVDRSPKSIGHEETFPSDLVTRHRVRLEAMRMADVVATRLRENTVRARTITIKVRFGDFRTITRSTTITEPTSSVHAIAAAATELLNPIDPTPGIRLLGVSGSGLVDSSSQQLTLEDIEATGWGAADRAVDEIRTRFGTASIGPASLADDRDGTNERGPQRQQWGPDIGPTDDE